MLGVTRSTEDKIIHRREKVNTSLKYIIQGIGLAALVFIGCIIGIRLEQQHQKNLDNSKESISTIAVVNMDDGVSVGEEHINYASQLINFPNDRFTVTGLSDAKMGLENGRYAAYIIIPETFSASVTSVENNPRKVKLEYQFNSKLNEETKIQAVNDVNAFLNSMNSNVAYMFVDAILGEFHRIQDDSAAILANDNAELERLQNVNIPQLIIAAEPIDEGTVDFAIQPVELASYISQNDVLLESLLSGFQEAYLQGESELAEIQETSSGIGTASANFFSAYEEVISSAAAERFALLETAQGELKKAVGSSEGKAEENKQEVENIISYVIAEQLNADWESANIQLTDILQKVKNPDEELNRQWQYILEQLKQKAQDSLQRQLETSQAAVDETMKNLSREAYIQGYTDAMDALSAGIESWNEAGNPESITVDDIRNMISLFKSKEIIPKADNYDVYANTIRDLLNAISIPWDDLEVIPSSYAYCSIDGIDGQTADSQFEIVLQPSESIVVEDKVDELIGLFELQAETEEVNHVIQTYFVDALSQGDMAQMDQLDKAMDVLDLKMEEYQDSLNNFDPFKYLESAGLNSYLNDISTNTRNMMAAIGQNNEEYIAYSAEVYQTTAENMVQLRNSVNVSNEQTSINVANCISELVSSREVINSQNRSMLEAFTDSLKYTRVESQGNAEVYDYIVNPLVSQRLGQFVTSSSTQTTVQRNYVQEILIILLGIGIAVSIVVIFLSFLQVHKKQQENMGSTY